MAKSLVSKHERSTSNMLQNIIEETQLNDMESLFAMLQKNEIGITLEQFIQLMRTTFGDIFTIDAIKLIFYKIDAASTGYIDWTGFITYIQTELRRQHVKTGGYDIAINPETRIVKGINQEVLCGIDTMPTLINKNQIDFNSCRYVAASQDGFITIWAQNWDMVKNKDCYENVIDLRRKRCPWLLDMVCISNLQMVAVSATDETIQFYDILNTNMDMAIVIHKIHSLITTMDYSCNEEQLNKSVLSLGDSNGNVTMIKFDDCKANGLFGSLAARKSAQKVEFSDILNGIYPSANALYFPTLYDDWVKEVRYFSAAKSLISCSACSEKSMVFFDLALGMKQQTFSIEKGVNCFDYDFVLNIIVTGGVARTIKIWNPHVPTKAVGILYGHSAPISQVIIIAEVEQVVSAGTDKCIKVWDLKSHVCLQTLSEHTLKWGINPFTCSYHNKSRRLIILGSVNLVVFERIWEAAGSDKTIFVTYPTPVVGVLYSELYKSVATISQNAVITIWNIENGQRLHQITMCHVLNEDGIEVAARITAVTLDQSERRLITAGSDGFLKMWSMGSGSLLKTFEIPGAQDVLSILCFKQRVFFGGWSKRVYSCNEDFDVESVRFWPVRHKDDIMSLAKIEPNLILSVGFDGKMIIWLIDSGYILTSLSLYQNYVMAQKAMRRYTLSDFEFFSIRKPSKPIFGPSIITMRSKNCNQLNLTSSRSVTFLTIPSKLSERSEFPLELDESTFSKISNSNDLNVPICCALALDSRNIKADVGNIIVGDIKGVIQVWTSYQTGKALAIFCNSDIAGQYTNCMVVDKAHKYLISGLTNGFIRIWYIKDYFSGHCVSKSDRLEDISEFPFLMENLKAVAAKTNERLQTIKVDYCYFPVEKKFPQLLSSYRGHLKCVEQISVIEENKIILSASTDGSVRIWTYSGRYIGTFGDPRGWNLENLLNEPLGPIDRYIPADVRKVASATTLQVFNSGASAKWWKMRDIVLHTYARAVARKRESGTTTDEAESVVSSVVQSAAKKMKVQSAWSLYREKLRQRVISGMSPALLGNRFAFKEQGTKLIVKTFLDSKQKPVSVIRTFMEPHDLVAVNLESALPFLKSHHNYSNLVNPKKPT